MYPGDQKKTHILYYRLFEKNKEGNYRMTGTLFKTNINKQKMIFFIDKVINHGRANNIIIDYYNIGRNRYNYTFDYISAILYCNLLFLCVLLQIIRY